MVPPGCRRTRLDLVLLSSLSRYFCAIPFQITWNKAAFTCAPSLSSPIAVFFKRPVILNTSMWLGAWVSYCTSACKSVWHEESAEIFHFASWKRQLCSQHDLHPKTCEQFFKSVQFLLLSEIHRPELSKLIWVACIVSLESLLANHLDTTLNVMWWSIQQLQQSSSLYNFSW